MPRPLRQKPTFLIATRCWGKNCDMAYFTVETLILGCITNLMKSTHWKPVNFQNIQLGFMLTTSLLEGRLSVMSTLGKTPPSTERSSPHKRGRKKKKLYDSVKVVLFRWFLCLCIRLWVFHDMCNLDRGFWELQLIAGLPGEYHPHPRLRRHLYLGDQGVKNLEKVNHLSIFQGSDKQLQSVNGNLITLVGC